MTRDRLLLDVGGTFIKCSDGRSVPVDSNGSRESIVASFREAIGPAALCDLRVAIPGPFDYAKGIFLMKHKFAAVYGERFVDVALPAEALDEPSTPYLGSAGASDAAGGVRVRFAHDVVAMLLGEVSPESGNTALVTLGTGLGFAMYVDGQILKNELGSPAVPAWNIPYGDGILEDYASKRAITSAYGDPSLTVKEIASRAFKGDSAALKVFSEMGTIIGTVIAPILKEYGISTLVFGGQISRSSELFLPSVKACLPSSLTIRPVSDFDNATFNGLLKL